MTPDWCPGAIAAWSSLGLATDVNGVCTVVLQILIVCLQKIGTSVFHPKGWRSIGRSTSEACRPVWRSCESPAAWPAVRRPSPLAQRPPCQVRVALGFVIEGIENRERRRAFLNRKPGNSARFGLHQRQRRFQEHNLQGFLCRLRDRKGFPVHLEPCDDSPASSSSSECGKSMVRA